ncbi:PREDICTED: uncharacterized protein LOC105364437 [Ceratosolen solmsi marchali]|uniref:Uncharacterized protein LOC105364437 n=1 Tax=Ceratosolen solmsi marchali TaxID=326594 RepID=A0AAJ6YM99_9HYME|nr:PREDICTED: uncharacterized protein LOC105364437 [Ceratosolen solmsi marchali]
MEARTFNAQSATELISFEVMTASAYKTSTGVYFLVLLLLCICANNPVIAAPQPIPPEMMYREDYGLDIPSQTLVDRLKLRVERKEENIEKEIAELAEEQMEIQALINAKARSQNEHQQQQDFLMEAIEALPVPAAIYHTGPMHSGKRTSYMALCHFKICNMGRKRQM